MTVTRNRVKKRRQAIPGIVDAARKLGVTREHLWQVLAHKRESKRLSAAYAALKGKET